MDMTVPEPRPSYLRTSGGRTFLVACAVEHVWGYAAGLDMAGRDPQPEARDKIRPWELGKECEEFTTYGPVKVHSVRGRGRRWQMCRAPDVFKADLTNHPRICAVVDA